MAYKFAKSFVSFIIVAFVVVCIGETLFPIPCLFAFNSFVFSHIILQLSVIAMGIVLFVLLTVLSMNKSIKNFEQLDL